MKYLITHERMYAGRRTYTIQETEMPSSEFFTLIGKLTFESDLVERQNDTMFFSYAVPTPMGDLIKCVEIIRYVIKGEVNE